MLLSIFKINLQRGAYFFDRLFQAFSINRGYRIRVNIMSAIKRMAEDLNITIITISDTTKGHKDNISGDGMVCGSYMIDHIADVTLMLRTSRDAHFALFGKFTPNAKDTKKPQGDQIEYEPVIEIAADRKLRVFEDEKGKSCSTVEGHDLENYNEVYAAFVCPKARNSAKLNPLFIYHKDYHFFEDVDLYKGISK